MLSTSIVKNISEASHYYAAKDNYYTLEQGIEQSEWYGKGANSLDLKGEINPQQFNALLVGVLPNGEKIGKIMDGKTYHRAGWDLTFSAPKSVSIMALLAGDTRLIHAHRHAVHIALSEVERGCSEARVKVKGEMSYHLTRNMVSALFHHDLSRSEDPQLHTHSVIMNMTERSDGRIRSMASKLGRYDKESSGEIHGFIERVRHQKRFYGKVYEAELAYQVKQLGYEIICDEKTGVFQIKGVSQEIIDLFSKRRQKIEKYLEEHGQSSPKAAEIATLNTRNNKEHSDRETLLSQWMESAKQFGFDGKSLIKQSENQSSLLSVEPASAISDQGALNSVKKSVKSLIQFKSIFTVEDILHEVSTVTEEKSNIKNFLNAVDQLVEKGELLLLENQHGKSFFMAKETLDDEKRIQGYLNSKNQLHSNKLQNGLNQWMSKNSILSSIEKESLKNILSQDQNTLVDGQHAKEILSKAIIEIAHSQKLALAIVAPNKIVGKQFALDLKKAPETLFEKVKSLFIDTIIRHDSTLQFLSQKTNKIPDVVLIDHAHLLSAKESADLLKWGETKNTKMIFFSNKDLLSSQKTGVPINYLMKHGIHTVTLEEKSDIRKMISKQDMESLIQKIAPTITDVPDSDMRLKAMANHFARLDQTQQIFLIGNNKGTVNALNQLTHDALKEANKLKQSIPITVLTPVFISESRADKLNSYPVGHVVRFAENKTVERIRGGDYLHIVGHDQDNHRLILKKANGKVVHWKPNERIELFKEEKKEWTIGERLQALRSMKFSHVIKGEYFTLSARRGNTIKLTREKGKAVYLDISKPYHTHFDYGYAGTPHQLAHIKAKYFIADLTASAFTTDQRRFFQMIAQPERISIYTDSATALIETLNKKTGNKLTAHEIVQSSQDVKKNLTAFYSVLTAAIQKEGEPEVKLMKRAVDAVDYAIRHLSERNAGFKHKEMLEIAMNHAMGGANREQLLQAIAAMEKAGIVLRGQNNHGTLWTTQDAIKIEQEILALSTQNKGSLDPIASNQIIDQYCAHKDLNVEKINAIKIITQSTNRVLAIQGFAGTGKTTMMASLSDILSTKEFLGDQGYSLHAIAPTHKGVKELRSRGITAQTVDSFLLEMSKLSENRPNKINHDYSKTILIVDEASMVSNKKMRDTLTISHQLNFRQTILTGDSHQLAAIESGKPDDLVKNKFGSDVITLKDIRRQKNDVLKEAVKSVYEGDVAKTFATLGDNVIEINAQRSNPAQDSEKSVDTKALYQKRVEAIVKDYLQLMDKKEDVQIITPSHEDRHTVNQEVRTQLLNKGFLTGESHSFSVLVSKNMTGIERSEARNFEPEQIIRFATSRSSQIKAGDYYKIKSIDEEHNLLTLNKLDDNKEIHWKIPSSTKRNNLSIEVFEKKTRDLNVGDKIVWVRTNRKEGMLSTDFASVTQIKDDIITAVRSDNSLFTFSGKDSKYQHWDHAYAITAYGSQGGTYSTILALFESYRKNLMNLKTFLVTLTRAENSLRIYTDNKAELIHQIQANKGEKLSSLEVIGAYPIPPQSEEKKKLTTVKIVSPTNKLVTKNTKSIQKSPRLTAFKKVKFSFDLERIKEGLNQNAEQLAIDILGQPKVRGGNYIKFGSNHGSLSLTIKGEKTGWWNDFSDDNSKGRSMLSFIQKQCNMNKSDAITYAAKWLGMAPNDVAHSTINKSIIDVKASHKMSFQETEHQRKMLAKAKKIAKESTPVQGTLAEIYLKKHRGIEVDKNMNFEDIRFHSSIYSGINKKNLPALVSIVRNKNLDIVSVETVFLDPKTGNKAEGLVVGKQTFGSKKGASVLLQQGDPAMPTLLSEGIVTGLSLAKAIPGATVKCVLGKQLFTQIDPASLPKDIILCLDFDGKNLQTDKTIQAAAIRLQSHDKHVRFMVPSNVNGNKYDYNDVLKQKGSPAIQLDFKNSISLQDFYRENNPSISAIKSAIKLASTGLNHTKMAIHIDKTNLSNNAISRYAAEKNQDLVKNNQKIHQAYEYVKSQKQIEQTQELSSKTIQLERDL